MFTLKIVLTIVTDAEYDLARVGLQEEARFLVVNCAAGGTISVFITLR